MVSPKPFLTDSFQNHMKIQEELEDILQRIIINREEALEEALVSRRKQELLGSECNMLKNQQITLLKAKVC
jgi:hypothetical protein